MNDCNVIIVNCIKDIVNNINRLSEIKKITIVNTINLKPISKLFFGNLEELEILVKCFNLNKLSVKNFPMLKILNIKNNTEFLNFNNVYYCNNIKKLSISFDYNINRCNTIERFLNNFTLHYLTELEELSLNRLPIFELCNTLINLKILDISNNVYIRKLPHSYTKLEELNIIGCTEIKNIPDSYCNLKTLYANDSGIVSLSSSLINLKHVKAYNSRLTKVDFSYSNNIEYIDIENTKVKKIILGNNESLKYLNIKNNRTYIIAKDNVLPNLTYLNVTNNKTITFNHNKLYFPKLKELIANNSTDIIHNIVIVNKGNLTKLHIAFVRAKSYDILYNFIGNKITDLEISSDIFFGSKYPSLTRLVLTDTILDRINCDNLKELYLKRANIKSVSNLTNLQKIISESYYKFPDISKLNNIKYINNYYVHCNEPNIIKKINIDYNNAILIIDDKIVFEHIKYSNIRGLIINNKSITHIPLEFNHIEYLECNDTSIKYIHPSFNNINQLMVNQNNIIIPKSLKKIHTIKMNDVFIINDIELVQAYIQNINNSNEECNICLEEEYEIIDLKCSHKLCIECLQKINMCPFCRMEID